MRNPYTFLLVWIVIAVVDIACWFLLVAAGVVLAQAYLTWPIVRIAAAVGLIGVALFVISDQWQEFRSGDHEATLVEHKRRAWK